MVAETEICQLNLQQCPFLGKTRLFSSSFFQWHLTDHRQAQGWPWKRSLARKNTILTLGLISLLINGTEILFVLGFGDINIGCSLVVPGIFELEVFEWDAAADKISGSIPRPESIRESFSNVFSKFEVFWVKIWYRWRQYYESKVLHKSKAWPRSRKLRSRSRSRSWSNLRSRSRS